MAAVKTQKKTAKKKPANRWSARVTKTSDAMDVAPNTFNSSDPKKIALEVEHDAEKSTRRKSTPYRSAMSMLTFYINRAGTNLSAKQRKVLEDAKDVLRAEFGPDTKKSPRRNSTAGKKSPRKKTAAKRPTSRRV